MEAVEGGPELARWVFVAGRKRVAAANLVGAALLLAYFEVSSVPGGRGGGLAGDIALYRRLRLEPVVLLEVETVLEAQLEHHLDRRLKSLEFLRSMR